MAYYAPTKELAEVAAARLTEKMTGVILDGDRVVTRAVVDKYADPNGKYRDDNGRFEYGVVLKWRYKDRPDIEYEFGGGFYNLTEADFK